MHVGATGTAAVTHDIDTIVRSARPGWFAVAMATGIVSAALLQDGLALPSAVLQWVDAAVFTVLVVIAIWRTAALRGQLLTELRDPRLAGTAFAFVAACAVLGNRLAVTRLPASATIAAVLAAGALLGWLGLVITLPVLRLRRPARLAAADVNGTWYLSAVGTQALAIAAVYLHVTGILPRWLAGPAGTAAWCAGVALYLAVCAAVSARLRIAGLPADEPTAPYWVAMGAASISVLAAAQLLGTGLVDDGLGTTVRYVAIAMWVLASCLIPVLATRSGWRHLRRRYPLRYRADLWMIIFPAGMYATASIRIGAVTGLAVVAGIGRLAVWPAVAAWLLVTAGLVLSTVLRWS
jgi:tellurite resistance protein TehA-like permease